QVAPVLAKYCTTCHGGDKPKGKLALDVYKDDESALKNGKIWDKVSRNLEGGIMPPKSKPQPTEAEKAAILGWIDATVNQTGCITEKDPGRVTMRRLNKVEYNNTIRDLLGVDGNFSESFPSDDVGYGFDNIGDVLSMPPMLMEKYLAAAEKVVAKVLEKPESRKRVFICQPTDKDKAECTRKIVDNLATRAYRRPATEGDVTRLVKLVELAEKNGDNYEASAGLALRAVLVSPNFLFRVELDREPNNPKAAHPINDFELASRLSYFLWSSMPDDELFAQARKGTLRKDGNLEAQAKRMLMDPKSKALVENFAGQWLQTRRLKTMYPDKKLFKDFNDQLREDMLKETELFVEAIFREDRSVLEFLDADYTFLNERLAKFYGIEGVKGNEFRKAQLTTDQRGGVLTMASILTITSNPTRTSPVKRGKWILENIFNAPPPPPPPNAGELSEKKTVVESASLRQRMEQHRKNPDCAVCHDRMDPLGFGFENYDAVGAWRAKDGKFDIDPAGDLPDGKSFKGPKELKAILKGKDKEFRRCLSDRLLTYALGRGLESYDKCAVDQIADNLAKNDYRFSSLVVSIVNSEPFQQRRGTGGSKP
ncbi:MAG TPA: DUF1592 domain-containing protein, partial [Gemmataceae bacterium]